MARDLSAFDGDTVLMIAAPDPVDQSVAVAGALLAGLVPLVVDPASVQRSSPEEAALRDRVTAAGYGLVRWETGTDVVAAPAGEMTRLPAGARPVMLQQTSGTTGTPQLCIWTEANVLDRIAAMSQAMQVTLQDRFLCWTPLGHTVGMLNNFLLCLLNRIPLVLVAPQVIQRDPLDWLRLLDETAASVTWAPNFLYAEVLRALNRDLDRDDSAGVRLVSVRAIWNAGERVDPALFSRFGAALAPLGLRPSALRTNFGCAEFTGGATFSDGRFDAECVDRDQLSAGRAVPVPGSDPGGMEIASVGGAAPGVTVTIVAEDGGICPDGMVGEILLRALRPVGGYLGASSDGQEVLRTGDMGYLREGRLFWMGRIKETINIRGRKFDPNQLAPILSEHGVGTFVAFSVPSEIRGTEEAVLLLETGDGQIAPETLRALRRAVQSRLGLALAKVECVPPGTLRTTASGKRRHSYYRNAWEAGDFSGQNAGETPVSGEKS